MPSHATVAVLALTAMVVSVGGTPDLVTNRIGVGTPRHEPRKTAGALSPLTLSQQDQRGGGHRSPTPLSPQPSAATHAHSHTARVTGPRVNTPVDPLSVKTVHLVQSNHLDIGYSDFASNVLNRYLTGGWGTAAPPEPRNKRLYYDSFFLGAANTSRILREKHGGKEGAPAYVYLVHPWVVQLFLSCNTTLDNTTFPPAVPLADTVRCPTGKQRAVFETALRQGDAVMHAFPHSSQPEMLGVDGVEAALDLAADLAKVLGVHPPTVLSQRDVPGLTRGAVPLLAKHGVVGISVGANDGSPPPEVPSTVDCYRGYQQVRTPFVWRDRVSATSVIVDIHPGGYGGEIPLLDPSDNESTSSYFSRDGLLCDCVGIPSLPDVMCYAFRGDNYGPAGVNETEENWEVFGKAFPNAVVKASTFDAFFDLLNQPAVRDQLPVVTSEIGDTWIYGVSSDPRKTAEMRIMMRARAACVAAGECGLTQEPGFDAFTYLLLKTAEHTWGGSYAGHMQVSQPTNWSNAALTQGRKDRTNPFYDVGEQSWEEQRRYLSSALAALEAPHHPDGNRAAPESVTVSPLAARIRAGLAERRAPAPDASTLPTRGYSPVSPSMWAGPFTVGASGTEVSFDLSSGAITQLERDGINRASTTQPLARFVYRSHSYQEKCDYARTYIYSHGGEHPYSPGAYTPPSPGLNTSAKLQSQEIYAPVSGVWGRQMATASRVSVYDSILLRLDGAALGPDSYSTFGDIWINISATATAGAPIDVEVLWSSKTPTRLPESVWFEFRPHLPLTGRLTVDKVGTSIDTADVVVNGGSALHAVAPDGLVSWRNGPAASKGAPDFSVQSVDAALVSPGANMNIWDWSAYNKDPPSAIDGAAFNLYNNLYDTNYILYYPWNSSDVIERFRFRLIF